MDNTTIDTDDDGGDDDERPLTEEQTQKLEVLRFVLALHLYESWRQAKDHESRDMFGGLLRDIRDGPGTFAGRGGELHPSILEFVVDFFRSSQDMVFSLANLLSSVELVRGFPLAEQMTYLKEVRAVNCVHLVRSLPRAAHLILVLPGGFFVFNAGRRQGVFYTQQQRQALIIPVTDVLGMLFGRDVSEATITIDADARDLDTFLLGGGLLATNPVEAMLRGKP